MFPRSVDDWYIAFQVISVVLALLTFAALAGIVITGVIANRRQAQRILILEKDTATARTKQVEAELQLEEVRKRQEPRHINRDAFDAFLKGKRKATAIIQYKKNDSEAHNFAMNLWFALHDEAEWDIQFFPSPIGDSVDPFFSQFPSVLATGGMDGVTILTKEIKPFPANGEASPYAALVKVLMASGVEANAAIDVKLPDDSFRIIIGQKP